MRVEALAAFRERDFRLLWSGLGVSNVGTWMQTFGIGWLMVQLAVSSHYPELSPFYLGLVGATRAAPALLLGFVAGAVADHFDRRRLLVAVNSGAGLIAALLAGLVLAGRASVGAVMAINLAAAAATAFDPAARQAMVPRLVPASVLPSAIGLNLMTMNLATFAGPLLGGLLIGRLGVGGLLVLNAASYLFVTGALLLMRPQPRLGGPARGGMLRSALEGFAYVYRDPVIRPLFILMVFVALGGRSFQQLLPAVAHDSLRGDAVVLSWLLACTGAGAVIGSLATASLGRLRRRGIAVSASAAAFGLSLFVFALQRSLLPALVTVTIASTAIALHTGLHVTIYQSRAPDHLRGRVVAASAMLPSTLIPLGALLLGSLGTLFGIGPALAAGGLLLLAAGGLALAGARSLRQLDSEPAAALEPALSVP
jgi:predicted MFS family arabinose efflux permease